MDHVLLILDDGADPIDVLAELVRAGVPVAEFRRETASLEEVFARVTGVIGR